jgi:hypothetical protein
MLAGLFGHADWVAVVAAVAIVTRAWLGVRRTAIRERSTTDRFHRALEGSTPDERPAIIKALNRDDGDDATPPKARKE